jgi:hypothetical protein
MVTVSNMLAFQGLYSWYAASALAQNLDDAAHVVVFGWFLHGRGQSLSCSSNTCIRVLPLNSLGSGSTMGSSGMAGYGLPIRQQWPSVVLNVNCMDGTNTRSHRHAMHSDPQQSLESLGCPSKYDFDTNGQNRLLACCSVMVCA